MLCFVQNDTVLFCTQELEIWTISVFKRKDFFYSHYVFKGAKLAKFIRFEAVGKMMWWCGDVMMWLCGDEMEVTDLSCPKIALHKKV